MNSPWVSIRDLTLKEGRMVNSKRLTELKKYELHKIGCEIGLELPKNIKKWELQNLIISGLKLWNRDGTRLNKSPNLSETSILSNREARSNKVCRWQEPKRAVCFWWREGICLRGSRCRFRHSYKRVPNSVEKGDGLRESNPKKTEI